MSKNLYNMTDLEITESFVDFISVEAVMQSYNKWTSDKSILEKDLDKLVRSLDAGGLTRELRKKKTLKRDKLQKKLRLNDPRLLQKIRYDHWLQSIGVTEDDIEKDRVKGWAAIDNAMKDAEAVKNAGIPPFVLVRQGTGSDEHYKIMDLKDRAIMIMRDKSRKDGNAAKNQQRAFDRMLITVKEHYGDLPEELEAAAEKVQMTIDFKQRIAAVLGEMVHESMKVIENQKLKTAAEDKLLEIESEVETAAQTQ